MVVQNSEKQSKEDKNPTGSDFLCIGKLESDPIVCDKNINIPYEKKYFALLNRCENIHQSNERLINRLYHVKKLIKRCRKQRKFLMARLDLYNDDYRNGFRSIFTEIFGDSSPAQSSNETKQNQPSTSVQPPIGLVQHPAMDTNAETITLI